MNICKWLGKKSEEKSFVAYEYYMNYVNLNWESSYTQHRVCLDYNRTE